MNTDSLYNAQFFLMNLNLISLSTPVTPFGEFECQLISQKEIIIERVKQKQIVHSLL